MPRTTASKRCLIVAASCLNGSSRHRLAQPSRPPDPAPPARRCCAGALARRPPAAPCAAARSRALQPGALQPVHRVDLRAAPAAGVPAHAPQQVAPGLGIGTEQRRGHLLGLAAQFLAPHVVHRLDGQRDQVEAVVADGRLGQRDGRALGVGRAHVHADVAHLGRVAAVGSRSAAKSSTVRRSRALGGEQQPLGIEVMHDGDVVAAAPQAGLVDADLSARPRSSPWHAPDRT